MKKVSHHCPFIILNFPESLKGEKLCSVIPFLKWDFFGCNLSDRILHLEVLSGKIFSSCKWKSIVHWKVFSPTKYLHLPVDLQQKFWSPASVHDPSSFSHLLSISEVRDVCRHSEKESLYILPYTGPPHIFCKVELPLYSTASISQEQVWDNLTSSSVFPKIQYRLVCGCVFSVFKILLLSGGWEQTTD